LIQAYYHAVICCIFTPFDHQFYNLHLVVDTLPWHESSLVVVYRFSVTSRSRSPTTLLSSPSFALKLLKETASSKELKSPLSGSIQLFCDSAPMLSSVFATAVGSHLLKFSTYPRTPPPQIRVHQPGLFPTSTYHSQHIRTVCTPSKDKGEDFRESSPVCRMGWGRLSVEVWKQEQERT